MASEKRHYQAFLLRMWQVMNCGQPVWRASLEDPHTGERMGFGSLDEVVTYLRMLTGDGSPELDETKEVRPNRDPVMRRSFTHEASTRNNRPWNV